MIDNLFYTYPGHSLLRVGPTPHYPRKKGDNPDHKRRREYELYVS